MNASKYAVASIVLAMALIPMPTLAQVDQQKGAGATRSASSADDMTDAEVRRVDLDAGKITLRHADIKSLDMPAMTMVFSVKDKAMLDKVKAGNRVKFKASKEGGSFTVTELQVVQ